MSTSTLLAIILFIESFIMAYVLIAGRKFYRTKEKIFFSFCTGLIATLGILVYFF